MTSFVRRLALLLVPVLVLAAACGGADDSSSGGSAQPAAAGGRTAIKVGVLPVADLAPLFHGISKGYFSEEGLDVTTEVGQGGAALVPAVVSGQYQFAFGNYVSLMLAAQNNVGVQIVSNVVNGAERADRGTNALLVDPGKGIAAVKDLAGRSFAVTTLRNAGELTIRSTLRNAGVDDSGITFVELPFPDMNAAVQAGRVDVAWQAEPFITLGADAGLKNIVDPMYATMPSLPLAGMFAAHDWLAENGDVAGRFVKALRRSLADGGDTAAMRAAIGANTKTPPAVIDRLALANWSADLDRDKLARVGDLAVTYEILASTPDLGGLVWTAPS
jgi:NitT/TauT family transport system substrate-binding protein